MSVYTTINTSDLTNLLSHYDLGELVSFEGIAAGIENTNYFVNTTSPINDGRFVLTIFETLGAFEIPWFLDLLAHLDQRNVPVAAPVDDRYDRSLNTIAGKPCALFIRLKGGVVAQPNTKQCAAMGKALAQMHLATPSFADGRPSERSLQWCEDSARALAIDLPVQDTLCLLEELEAQKEVPRAELPNGVIHADLFHDNALFDGDQLSGMIDFYYASSDAYMYDLAVAVNDWCRADNNQMDANRYQAFVSAYLTERPSTKDEADHWPMMLRAAALRFWLSRLVDFHNPKEGELVHTKDPSVFGELLRWHRANVLSLENTGA